MSCSAARLEANRRNAQRSTGPTTPDGKAAARLNAFKHGLAGAGDLIGPGEDAELVASRAVAFVRELDAPGAVGFVLAHRAALLSVRMERSGNRDLIVTAANMAAARDQFDQDRQDVLDGWLATLDDPGATPEALTLALLGLEADPDGLEQLSAAWVNLQGAIAGPDPTAATRAAGRARVWFDSRGGQLATSPAPLALPFADRIAAEVARLRHLACSSPALAAEVDLLREEVGIIASFDPSPEATLARRYEAAAERGMYRALGAIAEIRRNQASGLLPSGFTLPIAPADPTLPAQPHTPAAPPIALNQANPAPLGSFRAVVLAASSPPTPWIVSDPEPASLAVPPRKKRPDVRQLGLDRR